MWLYLRVMSPKDADGMTNSVDPGLIWVYTICPGLSVRKLRIVTVIVKIGSGFFHGILVTNIHMQ